MITPYEKSPHIYFYDLFLRGRRILLGILRYFGVQGKIPR